jgi:hypothetical protein
MICNFKFLCICPVPDQRVKNVLSYSVRTQNFIFMSFTYVNQSELSRILGLLLEVDVSPTKKIKNLEKHQRRQELGPKM